jgi:dihydroorotate dehydrogenase (fumarate)
MATLQTTFMGIPLRSPLVVAASTLSNQIDRIQRAEAAGAGALVKGSVFEEQIELEQAALKTGTLHIDSEHVREAFVHFSTLDSEAARVHLMWVKKARDAVEMPIIASLNAATPSGWVSYARELENLGVDGLELNVYMVAAAPTMTAMDVEAQLFEMVGNVIGAVDIPVSVKLGPFYTSLSHVAHHLDRMGVAGLVLFNRFLQPDINIEAITLERDLHLSTPEELRLPLRWTAILANQVECDIALTTGVHSAEDAIKAILAGGQVVQMASILYVKGFGYLRDVAAEMLKWMDEKGYGSLDDFRGLLSQPQTDDPAAFERAEYVKLITSKH